MYELLVNIRSKGWCGQDRCVCITGTILGLGDYIYHGSVIFFFLYIFFFLFLFVFFWQNLKDFYKSRGRVEIIYKLRLNFSLKGVNIFCK